MTKYIFCLIIIFGCYFNGFLANLPSFIHVCHKEDPNINNCMIAAVEDIRPYLVTGVPESQIPALEPLIFNDFISEEVAGMKIVTTNVSTYGCSDYFVRDVTMNMDTHTFELHIDMPKLRIYADYSVDGKLVLVPVKGSGKMEANITDSSSKTILKSELYEKDGETYLRYISVEIHIIKAGSAHVEIKNLFNSDKVLLGVINDIINKNLDVFMKEMLPVIEKALAAEILLIANKIVEPFTFKQLFPH